MPDVTPIGAPRRLRGLSLVMQREPDAEVLASLPGLVGVVHGKGFRQEVPWPDVIRLPAGHPLREEWFAASMPDTLVRHEGGFGDPCIRDQSPPKRGLNDRIGDVRGR